MSHFWPVSTHCATDGQMDGRMDGWMDRWTDGRTDGRTDTASYRDARTHLKRNIAFPAKADQL